MAAPDLEPLQTRPFRAVLACAVRGVRRVLPLVEESEKGALLCEQIIGFSHSLAAGVQIEPIQLTETVDDLRNQSRKDNIPITAKIARSAVGHLSESTENAAHILLIADPRSLGKALEERRARAFEAAGMSFAAAWNATGAGPQSLEQSVIFPPGDVKIAAASFEKDLRTLGAVARAEEDWLGLPFDAGDEGRFGELWPHGVAPAWYRMASDKLTIVSVEDPMRPPENIGTADVICWLIKEPNDMTRNAIIVFIAKITNERSLNGQLPPVFVVYAPGLDDTVAGELIARGATVFTDRIARQTPKDSRELVEAAAMMMGGESTRRQRRDFWEYAERRAKNLGSADQSHGILRNGITWDRSQEVVGSSEQYKSIVDFSKPLNERLNSETGWPINV